MNTKRLIALAEELEHAPRKNFDMSSYFPWKTVDSEGYIDFKKCGTAGCIAGHAICMFLPKRQKKHFNEMDSATSAKNLLGLTNDQADWLFLGFWSLFGTQETSPKRAAQAVRYLIAHAALTDNPLAVPPNARNM